MAFRRYGVEGVSVAATAEELGLSVDQVYQAKSRIVRRLAELVAEQVAEEG
jgi:DNA-directed RNA polymerase specialized sigma24 family protein